MKLKTLLALVAGGIVATSSAMANDDPFKSASAVTLLDSTYVSVQPTGSGTFNITRVIKIQDKAAALANHCIVYDYDPLTAFARFKSAEIRHADGAVTNVDTRDAKDYAASARLIFWGARQTMLEIGHLKVGDTLRYEIEKKGFTYALLSDGEAFGGGSGTMGFSAGGGDEDRFIPPMRGHFYDIVPFWVDQPTRRKVYSLSLPDTCKLQYKLYQYDGVYKESNDVKQGRRVLTITLENQLPFKKEPSMLDLFDVAPKLMLSTTENWHAKSRWFYGVNENYGSFKSTPEAKAIVAEVLKGKKTEMEKIAALCHWSADNIRYMGMPMGEGEGYTCHTLDMDITDRAGVCKDIAGTLIGLLRTAGFKAYPAMTMAGSRVEKIPADHFNHCVCIVKLKDGTMMPLDPTWTPFVRELWSSAEQQQNYLPGTPEGSDLCETPVSAPENHYFRINAQNELLADGTLRGKFTLEAEGQSDATVRGMFTKGWMVRWQQDLEAQLLRVSPQAKMLSVDYGPDPKDYQAAPIKLVFDYEIPDYAVGGAQGLVFKPLVMNNLYRSVLSFLNVGGDADHHNYGFRDRCSRLVQFDETITLPEGMKMQNSPMKSEISTPVASIDASLAQDGNSLRLKLEAAFNKRRYEAAEWPDYKKVVDNYKKYQEYIYIK